MLSNKLKNTIRRVYFSNKAITIGGIVRILGKHKVHVTEEEVREVLSVDKADLHWDWVKKYISDYSDVRSHWVWTGATEGKGTPIIWTAHKRYKKVVSFVTWAKFRGCTEGLRLFRVCDRPLCVNPFHYAAGLRVQIRDNC